MKKVLFIVILAIGILVALFFAFNAYIYNEKQADDSAPRTYQYDTNSVE